jgi:two-component system, NarL family, sensor histidine kinase DevS
MGAEERNTRTRERGRLDGGLEIQERERRRWAHELHDETLQGLAALRMLLAAARRQGDPGQLAEAVDTALDMVTDEIQKLRHLIVDLRPAELDDVGLEAAIDKLAARVATLGGPDVTTEVRLDYERGRSTARLTPEIETAVYRIVQEGLANAVKHAGANSVHVRVVEAKGRIEARISDDGRGLRGGTSDNHFGIIGMRERATLVDGRLRVLTSSEGTTVHFVAPVVRFR